MDDNPYRAPQARSYSRDDAQHDDGNDDGNRGPLHHELDPTGRLFALAAQRSGLVVDGLRFVFDSKAWVADLLHLEPSQPANPSQLCTAVVLYAQEIYAGEALNALQDWGLVTGLDVGRYAAVLVDHQLLSEREVNPPHEFDVIGPLARLSRPIR